MNKILAIVLIVVFAILGIVVGNQYGRRDVANSRPPQVEGAVGQPSLISTQPLSETATTPIPSIQGPLFVYNQTRNTMLGAVSLVTQGDKTNVVVALDKLPVLSPTSKATSLKVSLFDSQNKKVQDLGDVSVRATLPVKITASVSAVTAGQYVGLVPSDDPGLVASSSKVE
jgi:hypothetical protein